MQLRNGRTYHDPLHGAIALNQTDSTEALLIQLIDTSAFQRLRRIRQLGPASMTFHGAEASRFTHSLGVMAIARRTFDRIAQHHPQLLPYRPLVLCAALLHDLGHGPFSHTCEEIFGSDHEHWTRRILQESEIRPLLDRFDPQLLPQLEQVYDKSYPIPLVWQLVTSQLDCDRLDYLMRDSYFTGASYGKLDLDRIVLALGYDPETQQLVVAEKGLAAIEHYLIVRYFMYAQVYNHPKNIAATLILESAFRRARELLEQGQLQADETVTAWLEQDCNQLSLQHYLDADDGVLLYHIQRWRYHADRLLADLCRRFIDRDLLKALDVTGLSEAQQKKLLQMTQQQLEKIGFATNHHTNHHTGLHTDHHTGLHTDHHTHHYTDYYTGIRTALSRGYTLYQRGIKLRTPAGLEEISDRSPLVKTLTQPWQRSWMLYPREIDPTPLLSQLD